MRYQTVLMQQILTNEKAQEIIDYVSQVYGQSYVGLWIYQAIGTVLDEMYQSAEQMMQETSPATADLLLKAWETEYGVPTDSTLTVAQRRNRILARTQSRGSCTPQRLATAVSSALGGAPVDVIERTAKNTFTVAVREYIPSIVPAVAVIERMKPAHLMYNLIVSLQVVSEADIQIAIAQTRAEQYKVEVLQS